MRIISWNVQAAKGVDGVVDVDRIAAVVEAFGDADVICLQEVLDAEGSPDVAERNQVAALATRFPAHTPFFGSAIDRLDGSGRLRFGNLVLSRLPVLQYVLHKLPQPADPSARHMPRQAIEVIVEERDGPLRIATTHLDYFSAIMRQAQVRYLSDYHAESRARAEHPSPAAGEKQFAPLPETLRSVYCGDFNLPIDSDDYRTLNTPDDVAGLIDCWPLAHPGKPHAPTCGVFDHVQWSEGPHCRDYFFVSNELAARVSDVSVDVDTAASDHQPIGLTLR